MPVVKRTGVIHNTLTGYDFTKDEPLTPLKAIRKKCLECCCDVPSEVKRCHIKDCTLWPYRHGRRPKEKEQMTADQLEADNPAGDWSTECP